MHRDGHGGHDRAGHEDGRGPSGGGDERREGESGERRSGSDTRFLQLEISEVLYSEAESISRPAVREVLLEEAKLRVRERFGTQLTALARLAVDDLLDGAFASLEIEGRIQEQRSASGQSRERLRTILTAGSAPRGGEKERRPGSARKPGKARR